MSSRGGTQRPPAGLALRHGGTPGPILTGTVIAAIGAATWLAFRPHTADMAAQVFRAGIVERDGLQLWDGQWYGGHALAPYSVLSPLLGGLLGAWWAGAISAILAGWSLSRLALTVSPDRRTATITAALLSLGALAALACGRTTYLLGVGIGAIALDLLIRRRSPAAWAAASLLTPLASPVAGLFLAIAAAAGRTVRGLVAAALAVAPTIILAASFPGGGTQPFSGTAFATTVAACAVALLVVPRRESGTRLAIVLYLAAVVAAFLIPSPVGANVTRLGQLAAAPLLALFLIPDGRTRLLAVLLPLALVWQWWAPTVDLRRATTDRAAAESFHAPLVAELQRLTATTNGRPAPPPGRVEVVWTRSRWEAATVANRFPLARGWERQLDSRFDSSVNGPALSAAAYRAWLDGLSVRWVALANSPVEPSAKGEADLVRKGLPWLRQVWRSPDWTLYEVSGARPVARDGADRRPSIAVTALRPRSVDFEIVRADPRTGTTLNVRWSRLWRLEGVEGCLEAERGSGSGSGDATVRNAMTTVVARTAGRGRLVIDGLGGGPHCR